MVRLPYEPELLPFEPPLPMCGQLCFDDDPEGLVEPDAIVDAALAVPLFAVTAAAFATVVVDDEAATAAFGCAAVPVAACAVIRPLTPPTSTPAPSSPAKFVRRAMDLIR
jgi:hypothetical protein